jgi:hypothetical protein
MSNELDNSFNNLDISQIRNKYLLLEKECHKLQIELSKKDKILNKLSIENQNLKKSNNIEMNSEYLLTEEFIKKFEIFSNNTILDTFDSISNNPLLLSLILKICIKNVYEFIEEKILIKIKQILNIFGKENFDYNLFMKKFKILIFQENFKTIMDFNKDIENEIVLNIKLEITTLKNKENETNKLSEEDIENINKDLKNKIFYKFLEELYFICFYMKIHEPELNFKFNYNFFEDNNDSIIQNDYFFYNKEEFSVIEGFPKENSICIVILYPPQYKNNNYFKGIKPYVYCIENPNEEMIEKAKIEKLKNIKK